ncbi:MAG TPA: VOC family protein [Stellaceae bacterium]|nr:VOC family protein [Stellaceae bacterium]
MAQDFDAKRVQAMTRPPGMTFNITKIGHVVLHCRDIERTVKFYTEVLGFKVSDVYPNEMVPGGMVFMRCNSDHHGVGFVGCMDGASNNIELNHLAFEVATLDEVLRARDYLGARGIAIDFEGRRRAGSQIAIEFHDPDGHRLEIFWGLDKVGSDGRTRPAAQWKWAHSLEDAIADPCQDQDTTLGDPSLLRQRSEDEKRRNLEHSLKTQAAKLGTTA